MQGDEKVIEYLKQGLRMELTAINQYFLHSRLAHDWGFDKLGAKEEEESMEEREHADRFIQRILYLGGTPNMQPEEISAGSSVRELLEADLQGEKDSLAFYREAAAYCESVQDFGSRQLFTDLIVDEEEHEDWLETQLSLMDKLGEVPYLRSIMGGEQVAQEAAGES